MNRGRSTENVSRILLADTNRWPLSARLAIGFSRAGSEVAAVCVAPGHPLRKTRAVSRIFRYSGIDPLGSLERAIATAAPDFIVPCCDRSVMNLHELQARGQARGNSKLAALIERSLGSPSGYRVVSSRYELLRMAADMGIPTPRTEQVTNPSEIAKSWPAPELLPCVLKADGTWGGGGVKIVRRSDRLEASWQELARMFHLRRALKRLIVNRDPYWLRDWWQRSRRPTIVQAYIEGRAANCAVVCWQGKVLAGLSVEVISSDGATGPASVVRLVERPEMIAYAERIAARLDLSGFFGLDFVIENKTEAAYLIEMNPRCTPLCHLQLGKGRDMVGALWAQLNGTSAPDAPAVTQNDTIAYFPQAWATNREFLRCSYHDIPAGEPELMEELLQPWPNRSFLYRASTWLARMKSVEAPMATGEASGFTRNVTRQAQ
jgi:glutathione synthase/RimK-type ligase-like ATP-grasp enzyme